MGYRVRIVFPKTAGFAAEEARYLDKGCAVPLSWHPTVYAAADIAERAAARYRRSNTVNGVAPVTTLEPADPGSHRPTAYEVTTGINDLCADVMREDWVIDC